MSARLRNVALVCVAGLLVVGQAIGAAHGNLYAIAGLTASALVVTFVVVARHRTG